MIEKRKTGIRGGCQSFFCGVKKILFFMKKFSNIGLF
jgi:hypothetical protein